MKETVNALGQPIGYAVNDFKSPPWPNFQQLKGHVVSLEAISENHIPDLYRSFALDTEGRNWTYMVYGPFQSEEAFFTWAKETCFSPDPKFYTISSSEGPAGLASFLRIDPKIGCIEIGHIHLSPLLQRTRAGTEALLLMIEWALEAGYRRLEWKCDALNIPSRRAAQRLGLSFEGIFRQATMYKGRNRDTAWYAATSQDWPKLKQAYKSWLNPSNFTSDNQEIKKLSDLTKPLLAQPDLLDPGLNIL